MSSNEVPNPSSVPSGMLVRSGDARGDVDRDATALEALKALEAIRGQVVAATVNGALPWNVL